MLTQPGHKYGLVNLCHTPTQTHTYTQLSVQGLSSLQINHV